MPACIHSDLIATFLQKQGLSRSTLCAALAAALAASMPARAAKDDLTSLDLGQLMELTVVGAAKYEQKQSEVAASASIITRQEIRAFGWRTIGEALASLPGIYTTNDRQYTYLGARGFGLSGDFNTRVLLTINGNRVNDPLYDSAGFGRDFPIDMDLVERIEFIPGPGSAVYGQNAMFGVVNVITRTGRDLDGAELALAYQHPQSTREGRVSWGKVLDNDVNVLVSASGMKSHGRDHYYDFGSSGVSGVAAGMDGERNHQFFARASRGPWSMEVVHGERRKDDPTAAFLSDPLTSNQYQQDAYSLAQFQYDEALADNTLQVAARVFGGRQRYRSLFVFGGVPSLLLGSSNWHGAELRLISTALADHKVMWGLDYQANSRIDQSVPDAIDPNKVNMLSSPGYRAGLFLQDEWCLATTLTATLGVRLDRNSTTHTAWSPRVGLIWQAAPATTFKALYGTARRAPNAYESSYDDGLTQVANPNLADEKIETFEVVADHRLSQDLAVRVSAYKWTLSRLIYGYLDSQTGLIQYRSGPPVHARGVEVSADKTWSQGARLRGNVSYQHVSAAVGGTQTNSPELLARLNLSTPLPVAGLRMGYEMRFDSKRRSVAGTDLGGQLIAGLHLSTSALAPGLEVSLSVLNLFDKRYSHPAPDTSWQNALRQDGRSVNLALRYRY